MSRVLVTGGAGFIGSHIVDGLVAGGHEVTVVDDLSSGKRANLADAGEKATLHALDIRDPALAAVFDEARPEIVLHLAAQIDVRVSVEDPLKDASINVLGTLNLLECARRTGTRKVVVASSGGCIYGEPQDLPVREDYPGRPHSPYGISKRVLHDYLAFYRSERDVDYTVLALGNVCGPRQDPTGEAGVVSIFLGAMLDGREPVIYGDGSQTRDFVYVGDVAEAFLRAMEAGSGGVYNIGTAVETSVLDLWRVCAEVVGFDGEPRFAPARAGELQRSALDPSLAKAELGWAPRTSVPEAVRRTCEFIASQRARARA